MSIDLPILAFNDVYRVSQRYVPQPGAPSVNLKEQDTKEGASISVSQFGHLLLSLREQWLDKPLSGDRPLSEDTSIEDSKKPKVDGIEKGGKIDQIQEDGKTEKKEEDGKTEKTKEGLVLFAGDVFNPSVESSVTRGSHMVPIMNALKVDCACVGNHDFDFGYPHLTRLVNATRFPWLLSNIIDSRTGKTPEKLQKFWVTERCGVKIGVVGLVEKDWIATIPSWPESFQYREMKETALELSKELRDPHGEHKVDIIIALTHCRVTNDIRLANQLGAVQKDGMETQHGVDLLIGGHDHMYYIGKGATAWEGFAGNRTAEYLEEDQGVRLIKSGTDFRDLSSATLTLSPPHPKSAVRRRTIQHLKGKHHYILPSSPRSPDIDHLISSLLSSVSDSLSKPVCFTLTPFDARSEIARTQETGLGNWVADVLLHAYAESLFEKEDTGDKGNGGEVTKEVKQRQGKGGADAVIICGGTLRGDSQYGPGKIILGDILEILPFQDPVVCIEIDGKGIWDTLESALSKWPSQEGRFPIVAGLQVVWDHSLPPNQRVKSIHLVNPPDSSESQDDESNEDLVDFVEQDDGTTIEVKQRKTKVGDEIRNEEGGRVYRVITREYMALGYDGFTALKNRKFVVDDEAGQIMSSIIRHFLLGSAYIFRHKQLRDAHHSHQSKRTQQVIDKARLQSVASPNASLSSSPQSARRLNFGLHSPPTSPGREDGPMSPGAGKRHVVQHDWTSIRDAMRIARTEHLSSVDTLEGHEMRHHGENKSAEKKPEGPPKNDAQAAYFVDQNSKEELKALEDDLAIVAPLVDGRLKDLAST
ncbi:hypothetical protein BCR39DRAFT_532806 [Naematelia encephala]|uniref:Metallo-dependent phosphatase-like protein n=1 Tax=Naematelia encephala TaxID=71784 RepID=A0A1Y2B2U3_9TREE|nr:hypothetical protein BCR39DRAFT_532806 [Naematelia encephala]